MIDEDDTNSYKALHPEIEPHDDTPDPVAVVLLAVDEGDTTDRDKDANA